MSGDEKMVERMRERIRESPEISNQTRETLLRYDEILELRRGTQIKANRHYKNLNAVIKLAENGFDLHKLIVPEEDQYKHGMTDAQKAARETIAEIDDHVKQQGYKDSMLDDQFIKLRTFINALGNTDLIPRMREYAKTSHYNPRDNIPEIHEILWYDDDVIPLIENRRLNNKRDSAWIAMLWASGGRPKSEIWKLTFANITVNENRIEIRIPDDSKTGYRTREIYVGIPYIKEWLNDHKFAEINENSDVPLWVDLSEKDEPKRVGYNTLSNTIKKAAEETALSKPHNPQWFRKSRASVAALREGYTEEEMRQVFGWSRRTNTPEHYIAKFGKKASRNLAKLEGADVPEDAGTKKIAPVKCPDCNQYTPRFRESCLTCGSQVDPDSAIGADEAARIMTQTANESWDALVRAVLSGEIDKESIDFGEMISDVVKENPDAINQLEKLFEIKQESLA